MSNGETRKTGIQPPKGTGLWDKTREAWARGQVAPTLLRNKTGAEGRPWLSFIRRVLLWLSYTLTLACFLSVLSLTVYKQAADEASSE